MGVNGARRMKAAVLVSERTIEYRDVDVPDPGENELLVRVHATGVCGSDLATYRGTHPYKRPPVILGHELCGVVERVGTKVSGFAPGDKVCSAAFSQCDACAPCHRGEVNLCRNRANLCHSGWEGSFAEYVVLRENMTHLLPNDVDDATGALTEPLSIGLHAVRLVENTPPASTVVLGSGTIGLTCLIAARKLGFGSIGCVDLGPAKGARARQLGADYYVDAHTDNVVQALAARAPEGSNVTFVASGHDTVLDEACAITRPGGQIVVVSYFDRPRQIELNRLVSHGLSMRFSTLSTPRDFAEVIEWLSRGEIDPAPLISHRLPLSAAHEISLMDHTPEDVGKIVLLPPSLARSTSKPAADPAPERRGTDEQLDR